MILTVRWWHHTVQGQDVLVEANKNKQLFWFSQVRQASVQSLFLTSFFFPRNIGKETRKETTKKGDKVYDQKNIKRYNIKQAKPSHGTAAPNLLNDSVSFKDFP